MSAPVNRVPLPASPLTDGDREHFRVCVDAKMYGSMVVKLLGSETYYRSETKRLREALRTATTRLEILLGRMKECNEEYSTKRHEVSLIEVPGWIEEQQNLLAALASEKR